MSRAKRLVERAREQNPLPQGTMAVGVGVLISGITAYGFLVLSARALGPEEYAPLSLMWALLFTAAPGFFLPLEQEVARALAARRAHGLGGRPVVERAAKLGAALLGLLVVASLVASPFLLDALFGNEVLLLVGFLLGLAGYYLGHTSRGVLAGVDRFGPYGVYMGAEGVLRLVGCAVLAVIGVSTAGPYGIFMGLAPIAAVAIALRGQHDLAPPGPEAPYSELSTALGWLLAGSLLAALLVNAGPLAVGILATPDEKTEAGRFLAALVIARVPLFLFQAVQASLLPKLAALAGAGLIPEFMRGVRRLLGAVIVIGVVGTIGGYLIGPWVLTTFFGPDYDLGHRSLGLLALASGLYMGALALAQALIALSGHARVAWAWGAGVVGFVVVTALGTDLLLRVELGLVAGSAVAALAMGAFVALRVRAHEELQPGNLLEAVLESPVET